MCWDEESVQSTASLEEPESFIIIKVSFSARLAFSNGIIHHVISLTLDYASHPNGKKIRQRSAWALISPISYSCSPLWEQRDEKRLSPVYFAPVLNCTVFPNCRCGQLTAATPGSAALNEEIQQGMERHSTTSYLILYKHRTSSTHKEDEERKSRISSALEFLQHFIISLLLSFWQSFWQCRRMLLHWISSNCSLK